MTVVNVKLSPRTKKNGEIVNVDIFHIDQIPDAMDSMGWEMAPKLMRHWFSITPAFKFNEHVKIKYLLSDARTIPESLVNDSIIKMSWAKKYIEKDIINALHNWHTPKAIKLLKDRLLASGYTIGKKVTLGTNNNVRELDAIAQVNTFPVGHLSDTIDDWYGAIGNANLKVVINGETTVRNHKDVFIVKAVGIYIKDTYDFVSNRYNEPLGIWSKVRVLTKAETAIYMSYYAEVLFGLLAKKWSGFVPVFNNDFRDWQDKHHSGGDFIVFSDVMWFYPTAGKEIIFL